ncbi:CynX/NimT family MFS transporter [Metabacillus fastidiosus]|uniref:MFS transporter n=3 Tax=Metabacillus fastidiosus TaxID=1458 RepID=UPI003D2832B0
MKTRNFLFILALVLAAFNLRPGITSVSPVLHTLTDQLQMSSAAVSLLTSIPLICIGFCSLLAGRLAQRYGIEKTITIFIFIIGISTFLRFFANHSVSLLITSLLIGAGIGIVSPLISGFIKKYFPKKVSLIIGLYSTSMVIGASVAIGLTTPIQHLFNNSWKSGLGSWSIFAIVALPFWFVITKRAGTTEETTVNNQAASLPLKNKQAWLLTSFVGLVGFLFYCFTAWMPAIVEDRGWSASFAGLTGTVFMSAQLPATILLPLLLKKIPSRRVWITVFALSELISLFLLCFTNVTPIVAGAFFGIGGGGLVSLTLLLPIDKTSSPAEASTWSAMTQAVGYMIGAIGPILMGLLHDLAGSFIPTLYLLIVIVCIVIILGWRLTIKIS